MAERLTPETQQQAKQFGQEVTRRGLPIGEERATIFAEFLLASKPPEGLLARLASTVGFIDKPTLDKYFAVMAEQAKQIIGDGPYYLALHDTGRSGQWVYETLRSLGLPAAQGCFAEIIEEGATIDGKPVLEMREAILPRNTIVIAVDDWAISSMQMDDILMQLPRSCQPHVLLLAATAYARQQMTTMRQDVSIFTARSQEDDIILLDDVLTDADDLFLNDLYENTVGDEDNDALGMYNTLFASVHKTPDNVPDIFTGQRRMRGRGRRILPPLILPVIPPYEK